MSVSGFTRKVVDHLAKIGRPSIFLIAGDELEPVVKREITLAWLLYIKARDLELKGNPWRRLTPGELPKLSVSSERIAAALDAHRKNEVQRVLAFYTHPGPTIGDLYTLPIELADWRPGLPREHLIGQYTVHDMLSGEEPERVAILGPPGCGKTTAMRRLVLRYGGARTGKIPVKFLISSGSPASRDGYINAVSQKLALDVRETTELLQSGQLVLLFDALNEAGHAQPRISSAIQEFSQLFPSSTCVITCRTYNYKQHLTAFKAVEIVPLDERDIQEYMFMKLGDTGIDVFRRIEATPALRSLCENHFTLNAIVKLAEKGSLPANQAELYACLLQDHLHWNTTPNEKPNVSQKQLLLRHLAFRMHQANHSSSVPRLDAEQIICEGSEPLDIRLNGYQIIERLLDDGILIQEGATIRFLHDTIREYLVALHCIEERVCISGKRGSPAWSHICHLVDEIRPSAISKQ